MFILVTATMCEQNKTSYNWEVSSYSERWVAWKFNKIPGITRNVQDTFLVIQNVFWHVIFNGIYMLLHFYLCAIICPFSFVCNKMYDRRGHTLNNNK